MGATGAGAAEGTLYYQPKRTSPSASVSDPTDFMGRETDGTNNNVSAMSISAIERTGNARIAIDSLAAGSWTIGDVIFLRDDGAGNAYIDIDAEL